LLVNCGILAGTILASGILSAGIAPLKTVVFLHWCLIVLFYYASLPRPNITKLHNFTRCCKLHQITGSIKLVEFNAKMPTILHYEYATHSQFGHLE
jgi:hypothetical protein